MLRQICATASAAIAATLFCAAPAWAAFTFNGDGTLTDSSTNLVWNTCLLGQSGPACATGSAGMYSWAGAQSAATTLNQAGQHGFSDWCVPKYNVLNTLWSNQGTSLPNNVANWHWTSDVIGGGHWVVSFADGNINAGVGSAFARLVRHQGNVYGVNAPCGTTLSGNVTAPTGSGVTFTATVTNGAAGTGYWIAILNGGTAPTATQVQAGTTYTGATVAAHGSAALATGQGDTAYSVTGLAANTAYSVYFVVVDGATNASSVDGPRNFTTGAAAPPVQVPTLGGWAVLLMGGLLAAVGMAKQRRGRG